MLLCLNLDIHKDLNPVEGSAQPLKSVKLCADARIDLLGSSHGNRGPSGSEMSCR